MKQSHVLFLFLLSPLLWGGHETGNGGDIFLCKKPNGQIDSARTILVDFYEAESYSNLVRDLGPASLAPRLKVEMAINRLKAFSPSRAALYMSWLNSFEQEASRRANEVLEHIDDVYNVQTPAGCTIEQIAIQRAPQHPGEPRYKISQDLWNIIDNDSRAGLILHEIIYREALEKGHINSLSVRYFTAMLSSKALDDKTPKDFVDILISLPFDDYESMGVPIKLGEITPPKDYKDRPTIKSYPSEFFPSGQLKEIFMPQTNIKDFTLPTGRKLSYVTIPSAKQWRASFYESGAVNWVGPAATEKDQLTVQYGYLNFFPDGRLGVIAKASFRFGAPMYSGNDQHSFTGTAYLKDERVFSVENASGRVQFKNGWVNVNCNYQGSEFSPQGAYIKGCEGFGSLMINGFKVFIAGPIEGYPQGTISQAKLDVQTRFSVGGVGIFLKEKSEMKFYPNGSLAFGVLDAEAKLPLAKGGESQFPAGSELQFREDGKVL